MLRGNEQPTFAWENVSLISREAHLIFNYSNIIIGDRSWSYRRVMVMTDQEKR